MIEKAREACQHSGHATADHFADIRKMVDIGSGAQRPVDDVELSRYACNLIVQNGDPGKPVIAHGQTYFALQTRRQELSDAAQFQHLSEDERRLAIRNELSEHNKALSAAAKATGVETSLDYAVFQDHGYKGLYGGLGTKDTRQPSTPVPVLSISAGRGFLSQKERFNREVSAATLANYTLIERGEFAYNKGNSKTYTCGYIYALNEYEAAAIPSVYISFRPTTPMNTRFFEFFFEADMLKAQLTRIINSGVRNDGLLNLATKDFFNMQIQVTEARDAVMSRPQDAVPPRLRGNDHGIALYGMVKKVLDEIPDLPGRMELGQDIALALLAALNTHNVVDYWRNLDAMNQTRIALDHFLYDVVGTERGVRLSTAQMDAIIDQGMSLAKARGING